MLVRHLSLSSYPSISSSLIHLMFCLLLRLCLYFWVTCSKCMQSFPNHIYISVYLYSVLSQNTNPKKIVHWSSNAIAHKTGKLFLTLVSSNLIGCLSISPGTKDSQDLLSVHWETKSGWHSECYWELNNNWTLQNF